MEHLPPTNGPGNVWPPPPTSAVDDGRSRLLSMLATYASTAALSRWVVGLQILVIIAEVGAIAGLLVSQALGDQISAIVTAPIFIQNVVFIIWTYHLYKNTLRLGAQGLNYTPVTMVVYQLIPLVNFVLPFLALREVWQAMGTDAEYAAAGGDRRKIRVAPIVGAWWGMYIIVVILAIAYSFYAIFASPNRLIDILTQLGTIASQILSIFVVQQFTKRQDARYAETMRSLTPAPTATQWPPN